MASDDFPENPANPGRNGTPVLFPFPNRIRDSKYTFAGKSYDVPTGGKPMAIHGFAISAKWEVADVASGHRGVHRRPFSIERTSSRITPILADRRHHHDSLCPVRSEADDDNQGREPDRPGTPLRIRHSSLLPDSVPLEDPATVLSSCQRPSTGSRKATSRPARSSRWSLGSTSEGGKRWPARSWTTF